MLVTKIAILAIFIINADQTRGRRLGKSAEDEEYVQADDVLTSESDSSDDIQDKDDWANYVEPEFDENFVTLDEDDFSSDYNQVEPVDEKDELETEELDENRPDGESLEDWLDGFEPVKVSELGICEEDESGLCLYQLMVDLM